MPFVRNFINRLNITQRFLASVCFFALPLGVLFYFNLDQLSEKIAFAESELAGNRFQAPAIRTLKALADYQTARMEGDVETDAAQRNTETSINELAAQNSLIGAKLGFTAPTLEAAGLSNLQVTAIQSKWAALQRIASREAAADAYDQLVADLRGLISHAGDTSNLTLDPEMDSYYLADVSSVVTAQTLSRIGSVRAALEPRFRTSPVSASTLTNAAIVAATLKESDFDRITGDLDVAMKENDKSPRGKSSTLHSNIEPAVAQYKSDVQGLINLLTAAGNGKAITTAEFHSVAARAGQSTLDLWGKTATELDVVLQSRIEGLVRYRIKLILGTLISLGFAVMMLLITVRGVTVPLTAALAHVRQVAVGNLSEDFPAVLLGRGDEIGTLARAMQEMSVALRQMIRDISAGVGVLSTAGSRLHASSIQMTSGSEDACQKAHSVAAAAEQMSSNVVSVASGMDETTTNLANVATATEQMTSNIGEIVRNSEKARTIALEATVQAKKINDQIGQLSDAANKIGAVTETINEISSQTNLLALNATIEAARAGASGKGFAIVASEIKTLAQQTAAATEDIKKQVADVQTSTASGVTEIRKVSQIIVQISDFVHSVAAAIEEQESATKNIARNISEASIGVKGVNERVAESSHVSREIARDIASVDHAAVGMANGSNVIRTSAEELSQISSQLLHSVERFKV
jgi:methyl-accepting chemotaxis protein